MQLKKKAAYRTEFPTLSPTTLHKLKNHEKSPFLEKKLE
jgi:hypothetical protein